MVQLVNVSELIFWPFEFWNVVLRLTKVLILTWTAALFGWVQTVRSCSTIYFCWFSRGSTNLWSKRDWWSVFLHRCSVTHVCLQRMLSVCIVKTVFRLSVNSCVLCTSRTTRLLISLAIKFYSTCLCKCRSYFLFSK